VARLIELLDAARHDRASFDCGVIELNRFFQQVARQQGESGVSRTFVMVEAEEAVPKKVLGFFSLCACEAEASEIPPLLAKKLPNKVPGARLGRLAVAKAYQGQKLGRVLLIAALEQIAKTSEAIGIALVFVDAKDSDVARFYGKFGFLPVPDSPLTLYMPIATVRNALKALEQ
jgi:GNAT superfamily N-acetyltransferase